jgi:selenocysteine-specific translation elongation factor
MNFKLFGGGRQKPSTNETSQNSAANYNMLRQLAAQTLNDFEMSEQALAQMAAETGQDVDELRIMLSNLTRPYYSAD